MPSSNPQIHHLIQIVDTLSIDRQAEVLDFALFLQDRDQCKQWDEISDQTAAALRSEFHNEDRHLSESVMQDYLDMIHREDQA